MMIRLVTLWLFLALLGLVLGCRREPITMINAPEQLVLYSLHPAKRTSDETDKIGEMFQGWRVLGKIEITEPEKQTKLLGAFKDAIARRPDSGARCFNPRHGLRILEKGKTLEYVVCFECSWFEEYADGVRQPKRTLNSDVQPTFDKLLTDAGIPIAPKE